MTNKTIDGMSWELVRENRYIVIKYSDLDKLYKDPTKYATTFGHALALIAPHLPKRQFLVIESDWPEYEPVWRMIEQRMTGAAPVVERQPVPEYFIQACDKFDWMPEEALQFYADGKHFDVENGRTRLLCSGAIASYALKNAGGDYAAMKGAPPEVAALQAEIERIEVLIKQYAKRMCSAETERNTLQATIAQLQAQLAERDALLREVLELIDDGVGRSDFEWKLILKLRAALSASAEPTNKEGAQ